MNDRAYRIALFCGITPLVLGVTVFVLWLATRSDALMLVGAFVLWGGVAPVVVGAIALALAARRASRDPRVSPRRLRWSVLACGALLLSNFPVAGAILHEVISTVTAYTVVVRNRSSVPLESVCVSGGGCRFEWDHIAPHGQRGTTLWFGRDGRLEFEARHGSATIAVTVDEYVTHNLGGHATIDVEPDGTVSVQHDPTRDRER